MNPELQKYYQDSFDVFMHEGWKHLIEDLKSLREPVADLSTVPDAQSLHNRQGQLQIIDWLLNRKTMFDAAWEQLQREEAEDA